MSKHFVFPADPLNSRRPDETFREQIDALRSAGFGTSLVSLEENRIAPISGGATVVYRGWRLDDEEYQKLLTLIGRGGGVPFTNRETYLLCHHQSALQF
jgi:hypothetical protein